MKEFILPTVLSLIIATVAFVGGYFSFPSCNAPGLFPQDTLYIKGKDSIIYKDITHYIYKEKPVEHSFSHSYFLTKSEKKILRNK